MHTTHRGNRKSKSNSNSASITGISDSEWLEYLGAKCGPPGLTTGKMTPAIRKLADTARAAGFTNRQIATAVTAKTGVVLSVSAYCNYFNRKKQENRSE